MLNTIKGLIKGKTDFLEAAAIIFEDGSGQNLDDVIVLGEEKEPTPELDGDIQKNDQHDDDDDKEGNEPKDSEDPEDGDGEGDEGKNSPEGDDVGNLTIDDEPAAGAPTETPIEGDDILNSDIGDPDQPMPLPGSDLPTPMGAQTGEPINPLDDILNVEIDLGSNTVKDVLPVPPANAYEALAGNEDSQHVDSGFGSAEEPAGLTEATNATSDEFELYGVKFSLPGKISGFVDGYEKTKPTDEIKKIAMDNMISMINNKSKLDKIEKDILAEERKIGENTDTDEIRIKRIKEYLGKSHSGKFLCTKTGKVAMLNISMPYIKNGINAWEEHEMWITSKGEVISFDAVDAYKESLEIVTDSSETSCNESGNYLDSFFSTPMTEAITFADEPAGGDEAAPAEQAPAEAPAATEEPPAEGAESEVTSAVRDKVAEADAGATTEDGKDAKEELLKKLGSITKNLEDAKKAVMSAIQ